MSGIRVDLCGIAGNTDVPDGDGIIWRFDISSGLDSPEHNIEFGPVGRPGASLVLDEIQERRPVVDVSARVTSQASAELAFRTIKGKLPPRGSTGSLLVYEPSGTQQLTVRRAARPRVTRHGRWVVQGQLELAAIDNPFLRAVTTRTVPIGAGSSATLTNDGDERAYIKVTTTGAGLVELRQGPSGGPIMRTRVSVASGTVFDPNDRSVRTSGGVEFFPMASPSSWLYIPPETALLFYNLGAAPVSIQSNDTYA